MSNRVGSSRLPWSIVGILVIVVGILVTLQIVQLASADTPSDVVAATTVPSSIPQDLTPGETIPDDVSTDSTITPVETTTTTPRSACAEEVSPGANLASLVGSAPADSVVCLTDGDYGVLEVDARRSGFVTLRSVNPLGAVFEEITIDDASFVRFEQLTVRGVIRGLGNTSNIQILGSDLRGVQVKAPSRKTSGPGPSDWLIAYNDIRDCPSFCVGLFSNNPKEFWPVSAVELRGNKIGPMAGGQDAIRIHNWRDIVVEDNEIFGVIEDGQHNDCLQSVWGGTGLVFARNYLHDNNCQTLFLKDGYTQDVLVENNLSIRNRAGSAQVVGQIWPSKNVKMVNNTIWDGSGFFLREGSVSAMFPQGPTVGYEVVNNVFNAFTPWDNDESGGNQAGIFKDPSILFEDRNVFGGGWTWVPNNMGPQSVETEDPGFINPTTDSTSDRSDGDWRLAAPITAGGDPYIAGITWRLAGRQFGIDAFDGR